MSGQSEFAGALLDPGLDCPAGLRAWNGSDPATRFAVYRNNVVVSLIDALADGFPVTQALVGEAFFRAMARAWVQSQPPRTRVLAHAGEDFPQFVERFAPARQLAYLAGVARLEFARVRAYHAADAGSVDVPALGAAFALPDAALRLRLGLHPSLSLLASPYAVVSLWAAHQGELALEEVEPWQPEQAMIFRNGLDVSVVPLGPADTEFVVRLQAGDSVAEAAALATTITADFELSSILAVLIRNQLISTLTLGEQDHEPSR